MLALVRDGRRARAVVVTGHHQHAAMAGRAGEVGMLEHVAAAIDARPLAVPHGEDAVAPRTGQQVQLLRAPDRGGRQVLVDARLEADVLRSQERRRLVQCGVEPAQRRTAVARHITGRVQAGGAVALVLQHRQARQRLHAGHVDPPAVEAVFVVELDVGQWHRGSVRGP